MKIKDFSKASGLTIDTLRYYDKIGILTPVRINNLREYACEDLELAEDIKTLKKLKFSIEDIKNLLKLGLEIEIYMKNNEVIDFEGKNKLRKLLDLVEEKCKCLDKQYEEIIKTKVQLESMIKKGEKFLNGEVTIK
ncbi:DNA-binding transcriptional regulator, MerR family [Clostridium acidisoli DSM 12555]|uniref:DNA-binding transcriptional regulator, MerR family n=1 Tax=Clostridium acidisoli DSM 12555 TaxID=1121291 RepID=A0A1W1XL01_9CLOT|nr:MerR family transcriptional regulator [Clostridium acidisoli]SMC24595.1 DNA-binding transcriptional regulator, MerR family [Clostridium acidisoli DSM 12555]